MFSTIKLYLFGGLALAFALLVGYGTWQSHRAAAALEKVEELGTRLDSLQMGVDASNTAILAMNESLGRVAAKAVTIRERVITMERNDATVKALLDTPLPPDGCLLDDSCPTGVPQRGAIGAVQPSASAALN